MANLTFPFRVEEIFPLLRRLFLADQFGVVTDGRIVDVNRRPVTVGVFEFRNEIFGFRRPVGREQFSVDERVDFTDRDDVELPVLPRALR